MRQRILPGYRLIQLLLIIAPANIGLPTLAYADEVPIANDQIVKPADHWLDTLAWSLQLDTGYTLNPSSPSPGINMGRLFDSAADTLLLNQALLTVQRPIDPKSSDYDFGFKLQGLYGSDERYVHYLGEFTHVFYNDTNQFGFVEANIQMHAPWFTSNGFDIKVGQFVTLEGAESIDPSQNFFYSHSYIFNFGTPYVDTGAMTVLHVEPSLDLYMGLVSGENTSLGAGDNNDTPAFEGGLGFNLFNGNLTILAITHLGPEDADAAVRNGLLPASVNTNTAMRYVNDVTTTWKVDDRLTLINDLNFIHDDALNAGKEANGVGLAQYATYTINKALSLGIRGEIWNDAQGSYVAEYGNNIDYFRSEEGLPATSSNTYSGGRTTYSDVTFGANIKPDLGIPQLTGLVIRPEIRYDRSLDGTAPFNNLKDNDMLTLALDAVITF